MLLVSVQSEDEDSMFLLNRGIYLQVQLLNAQYFPALSHFFPWRWEIFSSAPCTQTSSTDVLPFNIKGEILKPYKAKGKVIALCILML